MCACPSSVRSASREALDIYMQEIQADSLLSAAEERELAMAIRQGDQDARGRLIRANLRLVVKIARDYLGRGLSLDDLVGEGNIGLITASERFDPSFGTRFSTYAACWIRQAIREALITTASTIRLPAHMVGMLSKWRRMEQSLNRELGHSPGSERVAAALGLTDAQVVMVSHGQRARRLVFEASREDASGWCSDEAIDPTEGTETRMELAEEQGILLEQLEKLDERERTVLTLRLGLGGQERLKLHEIGKRLGVTREWVRKIEQKAMRKLSQLVQERMAQAPPSTHEPSRDRKRPVGRPRKAARPLALQAV